MFYSRIVEFKRTSDACPTQWAFKTEDGKEGYGRYRWGTLRIELNGATILYIELGGSFDGKMSNKDFFNHLNNLGFQRIK